MTYRIQGFYLHHLCSGSGCLLLEREKGVVSAKSSYPEAKTHDCVSFPERVTEDALKANDCRNGFPC